MADVNIGKPLIVLLWTLFSLSTGILFARMIVRALRRINLGLDDYLMLAAWVSEFIHSICVTLAYKWGLGRHFWYLNDTQQLEAIKWSYMLQAWAIASSMFGRLSFCIFLIRILGPNKSWQKKLLWGCIAIQVVANIGCIIQIYSQCGTHVTALWDSSVNATCQDSKVQTIIGFVQSSINSLTDFILTVLPATILWRLQMRKRIKIGLIGVLGLSVFALVASVVKAVEIKTLNARGDFTYNLVVFQIWVCIENNIVISAASIPVLRPLAKKQSSSAALSYSELPDSHGRRVGSRHDAVYKANVTTRVRSGLGSITPPGDGGSEQYILQPLGDEQRITKTTEVHVRYSQE